MKVRAEFLCSIWQERRGVNIYSNTDKLLPLLESDDLTPFIPGYFCKLDRADTSYEIWYYEQERFLLDCSDDNKSIVVRGNLKLVTDGEVVPYLACALMEIQRQAVGQTSAHTAAVSLNGQGVLLMGKEGSGKTLMALHLCREYGYKLLANDIAIIGYKKDRAFIYEGTKVFWIRRKPIQTHYPDLVRFFPSSSGKDPWMDRIAVSPQQIRVRVERGIVPLTAVFLLHVDNSIERLHVEHSKGKWPRLYLYENFSRYIRRTCSPLMGNKDFHYLAYLPSLDNADFHNKRAILIDYLIDKVGIQYLVGSLKAVGEKIHQLVTSL